MTRVDKHGRSTLYTGSSPHCASAAANGFAMLRDGSFLIASLSGEGVVRLDRSGNVTPYLSEVDGRQIRCANFVLLDEFGRVWICCMTQADRRTLKSYPRTKRDGYIIVVDEHGPRIVADNINYPNEVRIDPMWEYLYTNETTGGRILRYKILPDNSLGEAEVVFEFDESNMLDGFTIDAAGGLWVTGLISNRIWYIPRSGEPRLLIEESNAGHLERLRQAQLTTGVTRSLIYEEHGSTLGNLSSVAFGGPDLKTVYLGSLMGDSLLTFRSPVRGTIPAHWNFGPFPE